MSAVTELAGAAVGSIWKVVAIVLAAALLIVASGTGMGWWLAADDRDAARAALAAEQRVSGDLRSSIAEQNRAVEGMVAATLAAQQRGEVARAAAAAAGKKYESAQAALADVCATTCDEAMPTVRRMLEDVRST